MKGLRLLACGLVATAAAVGTFYGVGQTGLTGKGELAGELYSGLVIYPTIIVMAGIGFWIVFAATDPGSEK
jgi:hypothetical protein